jgi:hypothetical protein
LQARAFTRVVAGEGSYATICAACMSATMAASETIASAAAKLIIFAITASSSLRCVHQE